MAKVRFGIVGVGDFGIMHIQTLKQIPEAELMAVSCRTQSRLEALCEEYDIPKWYTDVDALVNDVDIDVLIVATGEDTHYSFTEKAIHAGKHVLLEKPICLSVEDGEKLLALDQSTELHILPGHILRYDASYNNAHRILQDVEKHGEIQSIRVKRNVPVARFSLHSRTHPVFMALAHDIDIITWLTGSRVNKVCGMEKRTKEEFKSPDIVFGIAEMENGVVCNLETQWRLPDEYGQYLDTEMVIMTSKGQIRLNCPGNALSSMVDGKMESYDMTLWPEVNGRLTGALVNEDQHMIDLVLGRTDRQIVTVEQAVMGIEFCQLLIQSCDSGRIVERS